jgi:hypothetical protein
MGLHPHPLPSLFYTFLSPLYSSSIWGFLKNQLQVFQESPLLPAGFFAAANRDLFLIVSKKTHHYGMLYCQFYPFIFKLSKPPALPSQKFKHQPW